MPVIEAETRERWSRPIQASIEVPMDIFKVRSEGYGPNVQIRLEGDKVAVFIEAYDHVSYLKSVTLDYAEFVAVVGQACFGCNWNKSR